MRDFVVHEIDMMTSECAQAFFKAEKEGIREQSSGARDYRVRQVAVDVEDSTQDTRSSESHLSTSHARPATNKAVRTFRGRRLASKENLSPKCFVCSHPQCKHFLADCETFKALSPRAKRQRIFDAKRCLNCLFLEHFVRECPRTSKCRICGPNSQTKLATALHECYDVVNLGAADEESAPIHAPRNKAGSSGPSRNFTLRKLNTNDNRAILLRTSAVKVVNPESGISALAYAQHDTGSQVTLISENLKRELGLKTTPDPTVTIRTLADQTKR